MATAKRSKTPAAVNTEVATPEQRRAILDKAMFAYGLSGLTDVAVIIEALMTADETGALGDLSAGRSAPARWARAYVRRVADGGLWASTRASVVRRLVGCCRRMIATRPERVRVAIGIGVYAASSTVEHLAQIGEHVPAEPFTMKTIDAVRAAVLGVRLSSWNDPELLAAAALKGLGLSDASARRMVKSAMQAI